MPLGKEAFKKWAENKERVAKVRKIFFGVVALVIIYVVATNI
jgi:predicted nucleic acid-binding Zn ribbon protein